MLHRRVSRGARGPPARPTSPPVNLEPTPATPRPSSSSRGGGNPSPSSFDTLSSSALHPPGTRRPNAIRSPRVAPMLHRRVSRGARGPPTRHTSPPAASSRPVAVGPSIHPAQSGGALRANGLCEPKAAGLRANGLCPPQSGGAQGERVVSAKAVGTVATHRRRAPIRQSRPDAGDAQALVFPAEGDLCVTRPVGDSVAEMPGIPSGEPPNLDSRLRENDGCAKVSGGGNPSPDPSPAQSVHPE